MNLKTKVFLALWTLASLGVSIAVASNTTIGITAGTPGKTANLISFASTNVISEVGICDATVENQCAAVSAAGAVAVSVADGIDVSLGAKADAAITNSASTGSLIAFTKGLASWLSTIDTDIKATGTVQGAISNASDGVATASTNVGGASYNYGFNGTTWDRLQVDASKYLKVTIAANPTISIDPCAANAKSYAAINLSGTTGVYTTPIIAGVSAKKTYICQMLLNNNAAVNVAIYEATTGGSCAVGVGLFGGVTAATGFQFAANGGVSVGTGASAIKGTATNNDDVCAITSGTTQISGSVAYVQQ